MYLLEKTREGVGDKDLDRAPLGKLLFRAHSKRVADGYPVAAGGTGLTDQCRSLAHWSPGFRRLQQEGKISQCCDLPVCQAQVGIVRQPLPRKQNRAGLASGLATSRRQRRPLRNKFCAGCVTCTKNGNNGNGRPPTASDARRSGTSSTARSWNRRD